MSLADIFLTAAEVEEAAMRSCFVARYWVGGWVGGAWGGVKRPRQVAGWGGQGWGGAGRAAVALCGGCHNGTHLRRDRYGSDLEAKQPCAAPALR